jgi:hypothetical protein
VRKVSNLPLGGERWVAAGEDQPQTFVRHGVLMIRGRFGLLGGKLGQQGDLGLLVGQARAPPQMIDGVVPGGCVQPAARILGQTIAPALQGGGERVLQGILRQVEVLQVADQGREQAPPLGPAEGRQIRDLKRFSQRSL